MTKKKINSHTKLLRFQKMTGHFGFDIDLVTIINNKRERKAYIQDNNSDVFNIMLYWTAL